MTRRMWILVATMLVAATVSGSALATVGHGPAPALAQSEDAEDVPAPVAAAQLVLGEQFVGPGWNLEIRDAFVVESPRRPGYSAIRASAVFQPMSAAGEAYGIFSLTGLTGYPELVLRDAMNGAHEIPGARPGEHLVPGSALLVTAEGVPARWTVGFEVPTEFDDSLAIEAHLDGRVVARWNLDDSSADGVSYGAPSGVSVAVPGDSIRWSDDVRIIAADHSLLTCGAGDEHNTVVFALQVDVTNNSEGNAYFPNVRFPETPAVAVWADGASARFSDEGGFLDDTVPLADRNQEQTIIPPGMTASRVLEFFVPRDARLSDVDAPPAGVLFTPPGGGTVWLDLSASAESGELARVDGCDTIDGGPAFTVDRSGILIDTRFGPVVPDPADDTESGNTNV